MRAWYIAQKDLYVLGRDRRTLTILLALPLVFITILGASTGELLGWRNENQMLKIAIVNEDGGEMAAELVRTLQDKHRDGLDVSIAKDRPEAQRMVEDRGYLAAVMIGGDFTNRVEDLSLGDILDTRKGKLHGGLKSLNVDLEYSPNYANTGLIIGDLVFAHTLRTLVPHVAAKNRLAAQMMERARASTTDEETPAPPPHTDPDTISARNKPKSAYVYQMLVPAYTVMFVFFLVNIMAGSFLHERMLGTLRRLQLTPISPTALLLGKMVPFFLLSLAQSSLLFLAGRFLYGMGWGTNPWLLIPVIACTSLAATSLGLLVATVVRNDSQVSVYSNFLVIVMAGISGCFMPRAWLPPLMQDISLATPHAWALTAYDQILNRTHPNPSRVAECCAALAGFAVVYFALGWWRFRRAE